jgi:hypothetical protein
MQRDLKTRENALLNINHEDVIWTEVAGIQVKGENKWITLIQNASKKR